MAAAEDFQKIVLRESRPVGRVIVYYDGKEVYTNSEYALAARWAQDTYSLTDEQMGSLYRSYKNDYDDI